MAGKFVKEDYRDEKSVQDFLRLVLIRLDEVLEKMGAGPRKKEFNSTVRCRKCKRRTVDCVDQEIHDHNMVCHYHCYNCGEDWTA